MKNKLGALLLVILVSAGLVASASSANAAYPGTVKTTSHITWRQNPIRAHHLTAARFWVTTSGTGHPRGTVAIRAYGPKTYVRYYHYYGGKTAHAFRRMVKGRYSVRMTFYPASGSVYKVSYRRGATLIVR